LRIAYFINQYPKVSHTFIRREILALERRGFEILRVALRGWEGALMDDEDARERAQTRYVLSHGVAGLLLAVACRAILSPLRFASALGLALRMSRRSDRALIYHLVYLAEACRMLPWLKSFGALHVHAHFGTNSAEIVMLAHALGGPGYSFTVHGPEEFDKPQFLGIAEKVRRSAFVVAISSFARSQLYRWVEHAHWPKVKVVHCGLEPAFYAVPPVDPPRAPRLVSVGRLSAEKGQLLLIEAARRLAEKGVEFELVMVGDGEMRGELARSIEKFGLGSRVRLTGLISTEALREEILKARALVLPSFAEGLPMVIMEAMALRRPVLTTGIAGIPELVEQGRSGWLIPAGSIEALTAGMEDLLTRSPEQLRAAGGEAYARLKERHSIDTEAAKLAALFREYSQAGAA